MPCSFFVVVSPHRIVSELQVLHLGSNNHPISWDTIPISVNESQFRGQSCSTLHCHHQVCKSKGLIFNNIIHFKNHVATAFERMSHGIKSYSTCTPDCSKTSAPVPRSQTRTAKGFLSQPSAWGEEFGLVHKMRS
jgi:hypothetical protein